MDRRDFLKALGASAALCTGSLFPGEVTAKKVPAIPKRPETITGSVLEFFDEELRKWEAVLGIMDCTLIEETEYLNIGWLHGESAARFKQKEQGTVLINGILPEQEKHYEHALDRCRHGIIQKYRYINEDGQSFQFKAVMVRSELDLYLRDRSIRCRTELRICSPVEITAHHEIETPDPETFRRSRGAIDERMRAILNHRRHDT